MAVLDIIEYKREAARKLVQDGPFLIPTDEYTRYFQINLDDPDTDHDAIYTHPLVPKLFEPHPQNAGVICKAIIPKQRDDDEAYIVDLQVDYDDKYSGEDPEEPEDNDPLLRPVVIRGTVAEYDQVMVRDVNGVLIRNSVGDPFDPPVTRKSGAFRFSLTKNYATLNLPLLRAYKNSINSDEWMGFAPGVVRIANITFERIVENINGARYVYWPHGFEFEVAEEEFGSDGTWKKYVPDVGMRFYNDVDEEYVPIRTNDGQPITTPILLNGSGAKADPDTPYWLEFDLYRPMPFVALNLE